jgi:hypothetical protein
VKKSFHKDPEKVDSALASVVSRVFGYLGRKNPKRLAEITKVTEETINRSGKFREKRNAATKGPTATPIFEPRYRREKALALSISPCE